MALCQICAKGSSKIAAFGLCDTDFLSAASIAAFLLVAAAGLLMGVAPSSLPMYSVVVGSVAARSGRPAGPRRALFFALGFALGIAAADALIGLLLAAIGLAMLRVIRVPRPRRPDRYGWARR